MKSADREVLLDKLLDLMGLHRHKSYDTRGLPYVNEDGSFGLTAGTSGEGLFAAYFMMDHLQAGGLLTNRKPATDLDTAMYTLTPDKVFDVFDGVKLYREDNEITVKIETDKPLAEIIAAIDKGMAAAQAEYRRDAKSEMKSRDERRADKQRDKMPPVASLDADDTLVTAYLTMRVHTEFPNSDIRVEPSALPPDLQKALNDTRPRLRVSFNHPAGENYLRWNNFHPTLGKVFKGSCAVSPGMGSGPRNEIDIAGSVSRLAADVLENDSAGARRVLGLLKGKGALSDADIATYAARIEQFDTTKNEVTSLTQGISQPIKVGSTLKIKAQP